MTTNSPLVTIAVPVLDEEHCIVECLRRLRKQTVADVEILVADGGSSDRTRALVARIAETDLRVELLDNPGRSQAAGLNVCLARARGPLVVRMDGHAFVDEDYVERCILVSEATGAAVVGGVMVPVPRPGLVAAAIAAANKSWWGAGPARFHGRGNAGPAETVYLGAIRTDVARQLGGWAEDLVVNEDYEFNHRVRASGEVVWLDPALRVEYQPRSSFAAVVRQYFRYGRSKAVVMRRHPSSIRLRQAGPLMLAPLLGLSLLGRGKPRRVARMGVLAHLSLVVTGAAGLSEPFGVRAAASLSAVLMHYSWSAGGLVGALPVGGPNKPEAATAIGLHVDQ